MLLLTSLSLHSPASSGVSVRFPVLLQSKMCASAWRFEWLPVQVWSLQHVPVFSVSESRHIQPMRHGRMRASDVILPQGVKGRRLSSVLGEKQLVPWQAPRWSRSVKRFKQVRGASDKVDGLMGMIYSRDKMVRQSCYDGTSAGCRWFDGVLKGSNDATHCYSGNHDIHNGCFHMQYLRPNASLGVQTI